MQMRQQQCPGQVMNAINTRHFSPMAQTHRALGRTVSNRLLKKRPGVRECRRVAGGHKSDRAKSACARRKTRRWLPRCPLCADKRLFPFGKRQQMTAHSLKAACSFMVCLSLAMDNESIAKDPRDSDYLIPRLGKRAAILKPRDDALRIPRISLIGLDHRSKRSYCMPQLNSKSAPAMLVSHCLGSGGGMARCGFKTVCALGWLLGVIILALGTPRALRQDSSYPYPQLPAPRVFGQVACPASRRRNP